MHGYVPVVGRRDARGFVCLRQSPSSPAAEGALGQIHIPRVVLVAPFLGREFTRTQVRKREERRSESPLVDHDCQGDARLTGGKILIDTYGGSRARI